MKLSGWFKKEKKKKKKMSGQNINNQLFVRIAFEKSQSYPKDIFDIAKT